MSSEMIFYILIASFSFVMIVTNCINIVYQNTEIVKMKDDIADLQDIMETTQRAMIHTMDTVIDNCIERSGK